MYMHISGFTRAWSGGTGFVLLDARVWLAILSMLFSQVPPGLGIGRFLSHGMSRVVVCQGVAVLDQGCITLGKLAPVMEA